MEGKQGVSGVWSGGHSACFTRHRERNMQPCSLSEATYLPVRTEERLCTELPFCVLLEEFGFLFPQRRRQRWLAKNKPEQWKLQSNEIRNERFVLLKHLQYFSSDESWLSHFQLPILLHLTWVSQSYPSQMYTGWQERRCKRATSWLIGLFKVSS